MSSIANATGMPRADDCRVAVIWIDWYPYHVGRLKGLLSAPSLANRVVGIELVGGVGVHDGLKFREELPRDLPIETLLPEASWQTASKFELALKLWHKLSLLSPETVLVPGYYTLPAIVAALWAKLHRRRSVLMSESSSYDHIRSNTKEKIKSYALKVLFDWAVVGGKDHVTYLRELRFPADRIARFYDVVDNAWFAVGTAGLRSSSSPAQHDLPANYFLFVGRLAQEKNVRALIAEWLAYRDGGGSWSLVVAGDGPEMAVLRGMLQDTPYREDVYLPGLKNSTGLLPLYAFASCFVLPSKLEPWGLVVNEAMAAGLPVLVSSRCGCARDLVQHGLTGWVFDPDCETLLRRHLQLIETLSNDERAEIGRNAAERVSHYSPERFGAEVASITDLVRSGSGLPLAMRQRP